MLKSLAHLTLISFFILFLFNMGHQQVIADIDFIDFGSVRVKTELALTQAEHSMGLSGRESLAEGDGMFFVFDKPGNYSFWMKDMNFPIDIIWLDQDLKIVHIKHNASPIYYPELYEPGVPALYVLEVVSGFAEKNNLKVGDMASFTY